MNGSVHAGGAYVQLLKREMKPKCDGSTVQGDLLSCMFGIRACKFPTETFMCAFQANTPSVNSGAQQTDWTSPFSLRRRPRANALSLFPEKSLRR